jgi:hypothetical protein
MDAASRRNTVKFATERRLDAMTHLVQRLAASSMDRHEIAAFLGFSPSGVRKYCAILMTAGLVAATENRYDGNTRRYSLVDLAAALAWLAEQRRLADLADAAGAGTPDDGAAPKKPKKPLPPGLHLMEDDMPFTIKRTFNGPACRDPLVAALFGDGPARPGARTMSPTPDTEHDMQIRPNLAKPATQAIPYTCLYCGRPSWIEPCYQGRPSDYCHDEDHGERPDDHADDTNAPSSR